MARPGLFGGERSTARLPVSSSSRRSPASLPFILTLGRHSVARPVAAIYARFFTAIHTWAKVDGREVYRAPEKEPVEPATATPAAVETPRAPQGPASAAAASAETPQAPVRSAPTPAPRPSRPPVDPEQEEAMGAAELFYDEEDIFGGADVFSRSGKTTDVF